MMDWLRGLAQDLRAALNGFRRSRCLRQGWNPDDVPF